MLNMPETLLALRASTYYTSTPREINTHACNEILDLSDTSRGYEGLHV